MNTGDIRLDISESHIKCPAVYRSSPFLLKKQIILFIFNAHNRWLDYIILLQCYYFQDILLGFPILSHIHIQIDKERFHTLVIDENIVEFLVALVII